MALKRVLLTGGGGFIGSNILESFLKERYSFISPSRRELDLSDTSQVDAFFKANPVDLVIHAAGKSPRRNAIDAAGVFYANTRQTFNLARHADDVERMIVLGSGAVYDGAHYAPRMQEDTFGAHMPADEYGFSKYVCERHLEASDNVVCLRLFGVFGKREDYAVRFISNLLCRCIFDLPLTVNQDRRFDYLYVDDLMPVLDFFLRERPMHRAYNVTPDETLSLLDLAGRIRRTSGSDLPIQVKTPGLGLEYSGDNTRLKNECPGFKPTGFDRSLKELHGWLLEQAPKINPQALCYDQ